MDYLTYYTVQSRQISLIIQSYNIQIIGARGAGKSKFVGKLIQHYNQQVPANQKIPLPKTGCVEQTEISQFFDITSAVDGFDKRISLQGCDKVFLVDQPGLGGIKVDDKGYLRNFGPGHFDLTFMLGDKGFVEVDLGLLKHMLINKKPVAYVRTQCDSTIAGMIDTADVEGRELEKDQALKNIKLKMDNLINTQVFTDKDIPINELGMSKV